MTIKNHLVWSINSFPQEREYLKRQRCSLGFPDVLMSGMDDRRFLVLKRCSSEILSTVDVLMLAGTCRGEFV